MHNVAYSECPYCKGKLLSRWDWDTHRIVQKCRWCNWKRGLYSVEETRPLTYEGIMKAVKQLCEY